MARNLSFNINGSVYSTSPTKVDRKKLYGWSSIAALDDDDNECKLVSMDETGTLIIPKGGVGLGILSPDLKWVERSQLRAVREDGSDAELMKSSYDGEIILRDFADAEDILNHSITGMYQLIDADLALMEAVGDKIYTFVYNYRDGYTGSRAFLFNAENSLFMLLGYENVFQMLSLNESSSIDEDEEIEEDDTESDEIDFSMF
ncbi:hypothetical protein FACS1894127_1100 [Clostridia bacterium]|nr:hypothetical protein FACS1894127_1100 [Clostridia bacterium]